MKTYNLFPTPIGVFEIGRELTILEKKYLLNLSKKDNTLNKSSVSSNVLDSSVMLDIKSFFESSLSKFLQTIYQPKTNVSLRLTQSWCNYSEKNGAHHVHTHPNSFISGVFYVQCNESDTITFYKSLIEKSVSIIPKTHNEHNSNLWSLRTNPGTLFLFSSDLPHSVIKVVGEKTRISLSFNTFPVGIIGEANDNSELILT